MPQDKLLELLTNLPEDVSTLDCSIVPSHHEGMFIISTVDFFFPLINDPYLFGKITACNVLSDMYAVGCDEVETVLMILTNSLKLTNEENDVVMSLVIKGFNDSCKEAKTRVLGGQTTKNQEMIVGGCAMSTVTKDEFVDPTGAQDGDFLVLTKPLCTQTAVNVHQWMDKSKRKVPGDYSKLTLVRTCATDDEIVALYQTSIRSMSHLNRIAAQLMKKHGAHAATDITGFGLIKHAQNLAGNQREKVDFVIERVPLFRNMKKITDVLKDAFKVYQGVSAQTSGGLLISLSPNSVEGFRKDLLEKDGLNAMVVGKVIKGSGKATFSKGVVFEEVDF